MSCHVSLQCPNVYGSLMNKATALIWYCSGRTSEPGKSACTLCAPGQYSTNAAECTKCGVNYHQPDRHRSNTVHMWLFVSSMTTRCVCAQGADQLLAVRRRLDVSSLSFDLCWQLSLKYAWLWKDL